MNDQLPSTPRPKLTLVSSPAEAPGDDLRFADTQPILDGLLGPGDRNRDPLGAASTLVWLAHIALHEASVGGHASREEWTVTRTIVESAVRHLVLAQAQRIVDPAVPYPRTQKSPLLRALRHLTTLTTRAKGAEASDSERVWQLARRLELSVQCLHDWTVEDSSGVSREEVFGLARELQFVYRDLQPLARGRN